MFFAPILFFREMQPILTQVSNSFCNDKYVHAEVGSQKVFAEFSLAEKSETAVLPDKAFHDQSSQTGCSATELSHLFAELSALTGDFVDPLVLDVGCDIEVVDSMYSWDKSQIELRKGTRGRIIKIDADGDAQIKFPGLGFCLSISESV